MIRVCFHGAESTGKSVLAARLEQELGIPWVPEYGREWAETKGTDFTLAALCEIARGQDAAMRAAAASRPSVLILDTDPLMTAAWAQMLHGTIPEELFGYAKADFYLLFDPDVPWIDDRTRLFGTPDERARFAAVAEEVLNRAGVPYQHVAGNFSQREEKVRNFLHDKTLKQGPGG